MAKILESAFASLISFLLFWISILRISTVFFKHSSILALCINFILSAFFAILFIARIDAASFESFGRSINWSFMIRWAFSFPTPSTALWTIRMLLLWERAISRSKWSAVVYSGLTVPSSFLIFLDPRLIASNGIGIIAIIAAHSSGVFVFTFCDTCCHVSGPRKRFCCNDWFCWFCKFWKFWRFWIFWIFGIFWIEKFCRFWKFDMFCKFCRFCKFCGFCCNNCKLWANCGCCLCICGCCLWSGLNALINASISCLVQLPKDIKPGTSAPFGVLSGET